MMRVASLLILCALLLPVLTACDARKEAAPQAQETAAPQAQETAEAQTAEWGRTVQLDGRTYRYNSRLRTCLFLGVDNRTQVNTSAIPGKGGRSDTMLLFIIDPDTETVQLMPISRDTMTTVKIYDTDRNYLFSGEMQITMQYAFGDSAARSCQLTKRAVSALLHGIPINYCCSLTLDGIAAAVNALGGLTLTLEEDCTDIDPTYTAGATITMDAAQVERFLRYRDTETYGSNNTRMSRQLWFIRSMLAQIASVGSEDMLELLDPYLESDLDADTLHQLRSYTFREDLLTIPGNDAQGANHDEFYVDDTALQELLLRTFYRET